MKFTTFLQFILLCVLMLAFLGFAACQEKQRRPNRFLVADGYVGWVRIEYGIESAPALPIEGDFYLVTFPQSGHLQTSSNIEHGWAEDEYYYYGVEGRTPLSVTEWGKGGMIWGRSNGSVQGSGSKAYGYFFIGSEGQFINVGVRLKDETGQPKIGQIAGELDK